MQVSILNKQAESLISKDLPKAQESVYLCIGTDKVVSDSLGPRVGTILQNKMKKPIFVYGIEQNNIDALNLCSAHNLIRLLHPNKRIVVIDAAVGNIDEVGSIQTYKGSLVPGAATNKNLPNVGDYSILGVVSLRGLQDFYVTTADRTKLINDMANVIANAVLCASEKQMIV